MTDDDFIPGFARKKKATAEAKTLPAGVHKATKEMFEPKPEPVPAAQPAKKKAAAVKTDLQRQRYQKAKAALERWQRKQNIAARRVAKFAAQVKRYEKKGVS